MASYSLATQLLLDSKNLIGVIIHFEFTQPEEFIAWQDNRYGSVEVTAIVIHPDVATLNEFSVCELIRIRRACWDYLETQQQLNPQNIRGLYH